MKLFHVLSAVALAIMPLASASAVSLATQQEVINADFVGNGFTAACAGYGSTCAALSGTAGVDYVDFSTAVPGVAAAFSDNSPAFAVLGGKSVNVVINKWVSAIYLKLNSPDEWNSIRINYTGGTFTDIPGTIFVPSNGDQSVEFSFLAFLFPDQKVTSIGLSSLQNSFEIKEVGYLASTVGGVPEPSTWAMMIAGFGMVGFGMRRRERNLAIVAS